MFLNFTPKQSTLLSKRCPDLQEYKTQRRGTIQGKVPKFTFWKKKMQWQQMFIRVIDRLAPGKEFKDP